MKISKEIKNIEDRIKTHIPDEEEDSDQIYEQLTPKLDNVD